MKTLNRFIIEKLKLGKNIQIKGYHFFPKDFDELKSLLKQLLEKRGPDADLNDIDVSQVTMFFDENNTEGLFEDLDPHNIDISKWDVSNVKNMCCTFYGCKNFTGQGLENWDVSSVEDMSHMFNTCENFTGKELENWDVSNVKKMEYMFEKCKKFDCDLSKWDVSNVETIFCIFSGCKKFTGKGLEKWNVSNVEDSLQQVLGIFDDCDALKNTPSWYDEWVKQLELYWKK